MDDFREAYRRFGDDELARLEAQIDTLIPMAQDALREEIHRRGLSVERLMQIRADQQRDAEAFDREQSEDRKHGATRIATGCLWRIIAAIVGGALAAYFGLKGIGH
jgi:hypothetical protein